MSEEKTVSGLIVNHPGLPFYARLLASHLLVFLAGWEFISRQLLVKNHPAYQELIQMKGN